MSEPMAQANLDMWAAYDGGLDSGETRSAKSTSPTSAVSLPPNTSPAHSAASASGARRY